MRFVLVSDTYPPDMRPIGRQAHELARALLAAGHPTSVVTQGEGVDRTVDLVRVLERPNAAVIEQIARETPQVVVILGSSPLSTTAAQWRGPTLVSPPPAGVATSFYRNGDRKAARRRFALPTDASQVVVLVDPYAEETSPPAGAWGDHVHFVQTSDLRITSLLHVKALYQAANVCLLTRDYPGREYVVAEAASSGLAVTDDVEEARALANDADTRREKGRASRLHAQRSLDWEHVLDGFLASAEALTVA